MIKMIHFLNLVDWLGRRKTSKFPYVQKTYPTCLLFKAWKFIRVILVSFRSWPLF